MNFPNNKKKVNCSTYTSSNRHFNIKLSYACPLWDKFNHEINVDGVY
jgi:hypothetical protein